MEKQAEREREEDKDGDVQIAEPAAADVPTRIANIEEMVMQLGMVGDGEICEHRTAVHEMLRQLSGVLLRLACERIVLMICFSVAGIDALRTRVGVELPCGASPVSATGFVVRL